MRATGPNPIEKGIERQERLRAIAAGGALEPGQGAPSKLARLNPRDLAIYFLGVAVWRILFTGRCLPLTGTFIRFLNSKLWAALTDAERNYVMAQTGYQFNEMAQGEQPATWPEDGQFEDDDIPF